MWFGIFLVSYRDSLAIAPSSSVRMETFLPLLPTLSVNGRVAPFGLSRLRVMLTKMCCERAGCGLWIKLTMTLPAGLRTSVGRDCLLRLSMLDACTLLHVGSGALGHDGSAPHFFVLDKCKKSKRRRVLQADREFAQAPDLWGHGSVGWSNILVDAADVALWLCLAGVLVELCAFLSSLHWPTVVDDLGVSCVSCVELFVLYERWAGGRLVLQPAVPSGQEEWAPNVGVGCSGWTEHRCLTFLETLRVWVSYLVGLGRFIPCRTGAHHCRLRALGWVLCGHGLTSSPRKMLVLDFWMLLVLLGYPADSGRALVAGILSMRYCQVSFAPRTPTC